MPLRLFSRHHRLCCLHTRRIASNSAKFPARHTHPLLPLRRHRRCLVVVLLLPLLLLVPERKSNEQLPLASRRELPRRIPGGAGAEAAGVVNVGVRL